MELKMPRHGEYSRGKIASLTGSNIETVRYYERIALMPDPPRSRNGHRVYGDEHFKRLTFILRSRNLGFTIEEIRSLLGLVDGGHYTCDEVRDLTLNHQKDVKKKISDLKKLEKVLRNMAAQCEGGTVPECPIIDALFQPEI